MLRRSHQVTTRSTLTLSAIRLFHASSTRHDDSFPDHYATLGISVDASAADIKKSFYALSKKHHPDINPDPSSSSRFVAISEAYHVLGTPDKRSRYDRDHARAHGGQPSTRQGSYSSSSASPAGARPASGLSRRRSTFRGPPPSFYRNGGWGKQEMKRSRYAYYGQSEPPPPPPPPDSEGQQQQRHQGFAGGGQKGQRGGYGPGQEWEAAWQDPDIPYWDRAGHQKTQEGLEGKARSSAAKHAAREADAYKEFGEKGIWIQFTLVSTIVTLGILTPMIMFKK